MSRVTRVKQAKALGSCHHCSFGLALLAGVWLGKASELGPMQHHHRLASDVNLEEEVELQRLEGGTAAARLSMRGSKIEEGVERVQRVSWGIFWGDFGKRGTHQTENDSGKMSLTSATRISFSDGGKNPSVTICALAVRVEWHRSRRKRPDKI